MYITLFFMLIVWISYLAKLSTYLSQSRRLPPLQLVSNSKFISVGVQSQTEINAPRGCAVILFKNASAFLLRDARHAMHDILLLRISAILPEAISDGGLTPPLIPACFSPPIEVGVISQLIYTLIISL